MQMNFLHTWASNGFFGGSKATKLAVEDKISNDSNNCSLSSKRSGGSDRSKTCVASSRMFVFLLSAFEKGFVHVCISCRMQILGDATSDGNKYGFSVCACEQTAC